MALDALAQLMPQECIPVIETTIEELEVALADSNCDRYYSDRQPVILENFTLLGLTPMENTTIYLEDWIEFFRGKLENLTN